MRNILITGGLGFIGSNLIKHWLRDHPQDKILNLDAYTYAARPDFLNDVWSHPNLKTIKCDIRNRGAVHLAIDQFNPDGIIHLAAESHVCNSIEGPEVFMQTNILGTFNLLEEFKNHLDKNKKEGRFHLVSTDEVFGEVSDLERKFDETWAMNPRSPYSSSKAASDLITLAWCDTYGLDVVVTNCSNNFGANQHEEKLIPKTITKLLAGQPMSMYGKGDHIRDWLYVDDHCSALSAVFHHGKKGERYCIGGEDEKTNLEVIQITARKLQDVLGREIMLDFEYVNGRPTDDFRYAINCDKIKSLGWKPSKDFEGNLEKTIKWYLENQYYTNRATA
jgi:dTDP-glucose 4,6-dehydratase